MLENVDFRPAGQVETGSVGQELECRLGQFGPPFARQKRIELGLQRIVELPVSYRPRSVGWSACLLSVS